MGVTGHTGGSESSLLHCTFADRTVGSESCHFAGAVTQNDDDDDDDVSVVVEPLADCVSDKECRWSPVKRVVLSAAVRSCRRRPAEHQTDVAESREVKQQTHGPSAADTRTHCDQL